MNVVDAGVVIELLVGDLAYERLGTEDLAAPHLIDSEVVHVLRTLSRRDELTDAQAQIALDGFAALHIARYAADGLRPRMWELRHNLSAYDATYVALAEELGATRLITTDTRLARAPGARCRIDVL